MSVKDAAKDAKTAGALATQAPAGALAEMFQTDAGTGFEEAGKESFAIPFLKLLQSLSPQCKKNEPEYIKGAEEGDFFNTVTEKVYPNDSPEGVKGALGVMFIPCYYRPVFNLWQTKLDGGGFRGVVSVAKP